MSEKNKTDEAGKVGVKPKVLTLDDVIAVDDQQIIDIPVPEWGGVVRVISLTAAEMITEIEGKEGVDKEKLGLRLVVRSLVDEHGTRIGTDAHIAMLEKKSAAVVNRIATAVMKLNGLEKVSQAGLGNV